MSVIDKFMPMVMDMEDEGQVSPIVQHGDIAFIYIKYNNLYLVASSKKNANVALVFSFLHKCVQVMNFLVDFIVDIRTYSVLRKLSFPNSQTKNLQ